MSRIETREALFKLVFEYCITTEKNEMMIEELCENAKIEKQYLENAYNGIIEHFDELKSEIAQFTKGYNIERIFKVDLALLIVAVFEIKYEPQIPTPVSINEAINLAKKYSTEKSSKFINGVLANFAK